MNLRNWLNKWNLASLKVNVEFLELELNFTDSDKIAAWEMYIELLTRIATQRLPVEHGDEKTALESVYSLFATTRGILKTNGRSCVEFTKIAIIVLNQIIRPFTAKWHKISINESLSDSKYSEHFRTELSELQKHLCYYCGLLSEIAGVEDLTYLDFE